MAKEGTNTSPSAIVRVGDPTGVKEPRARRTNRQSRRTRVQRFALVPTQALEGFGSMTLAEGCPHSLRKYRKSDEYGRYVIANVVWKDPESLMAFITLIITGGGVSSPPRRFNQG
jgi:hypothetical protein